MESELVIRSILIAFGLGLVFGAWAGYALRGPRAARLERQIAALQEKLEAAVRALE